MSDHSLRQLSTIVCERDIPLAVDSSIIYASKLEGKWRYDGKVYQSDIERRSPYNTRLYPGLPPGPVASPGESSLKAALNPATSDYLYYVRNPDRDDGAHNFYSNGAEFETGVQALRRWERERDAGRSEEETRECNFGQVEKLRLRGNRFFDFLLPSRACL